MVFKGIADLAVGSLMQYIYTLTVATSPGAVFFVSAGCEILSLVAISIFYVFILKHERIFGELGREQGGATQ